YAWMFRVQRYFFNMQQQERLSRLDYLAIRRVLPEKFLHYLDRTVALPARNDHNKFDEIFEDVETMGGRRRQALK
ncbi:hypothetical protein L917_00754, partial [Phytophthora nicotianae]